MRNGMHRVRASARPAWAARAVAAFVSAVVVMALPATAWAQRGTQDRTKEQIREEARKVLGRESAPAGKDGEARATEGKWTIAIVSLRGPERDEATPVALARIRTEGGLPEAFAERRASATIIAVGLFDSPDDERAKAELKRVQEMTVGGVQAYAQAFLCPPESGVKLGSNPEYNLLRAKEIYGSAAIQTLQVGVYGRDDLKNPTEKDLAEVRKLAEQAAVKLRQEGELAFYYHGPRRSMVTIGVFDLSDFDPQVPSYNSARLLAVKRRHPHNLYNGQGIRERNPQGNTARLQPSTLVAIPDPPVRERPAGGGGAGGGGGGSPRR